MPPVLKYFLTLLLPFAVIGQDKNEEFLQWDPNYKLTWEDYKANPDPGSEAAATTTTYLGIEYNINRNQFTYRIQCRFSKNRSWGLHKTNYILAHEQGHFDIAEVYARKLNREMSNYRFNKSTYQEDLKAIYQRLMEEKDAMQEMYDRETNHSINRKKQAEWQVKISDMLDAYQEYAQYK